MIPTISLLQCCQALTKFSHLPAKMESLHASLYNQFKESKTNQTSLCFDCWFVAYILLVFSHTILSLLIVVLIQPILLTFQRILLTSTKILLAVHLLDSVRITVISFSFSRMICSHSITICCDFIHLTNTSLHITSHHITLYHIQPNIPRT